MGIVIPCGVRLAPFCQVAMQPKIRKEFGGSWIAFWQEDACARQMHTKADTEAKQLQGAFLYIENHLVRALCMSLMDHIVLSLYYGCNIVMDLARSS